MSITISDCSQICKSPLNNSTAKMLYSFPKESRFTKRKQIICDKFYTQSSNSHLRTTSFGFGDKYDFTRDASCSPPPNTYNLEDSFTKNIKKGFGFGKSRDQMEVTGPFVNSKKNKNPGPDSYQLPSMLQKKSFAFRSKLNTFDQSKRNVPGPGTYPVTFPISQKGRYFLTKYKTVCARDFSKYLGRCHTSQQKNPGPGAYSVQGVDLSPKGKYVSSRLHNCLASSFEGSERKFLGDRSNTPGPGNYKLPSDFGHYEAGKKFTQVSQKVQKSTIKLNNNQITKSSFGSKVNLKGTTKRSQNEIKDQNTNIQSKQIVNENTNINLNQQKIDIEKQVEVKDSPIQSNQI